MEEDIIIPPPTGFSGMIREIQVGMEFLVITSLFVFAKKFLSSWRKTEKPIFRDEFLLFLLIGISRIVLMVYDFWIYKDYVNWEFLWKIGMVLQMAGVSIFTRRVEEDIYNRKTHYILTVCNVVAILILIPLPYWEAHYPSAIPLITVAIIALTYLYVGLKVGGEIRKKALLITAGIFLIAIGMLLRFEPFIEPIIRISEIIGKLLLWIVSLPGFVMLGLGFETK